MRGYKKLLNLYKTGLLRLRGDLLQRSGSKFCTDKTPRIFLKIPPLESVLLLVSGIVLLSCLKSASFTAGSYIPTHVFWEKNKEERRTFHYSYCKAYLVNHKPLKTCRTCESCTLKPWGSLRSGPDPFSRVFSWADTKVMVTQRPSRKCGTNWGQHKTSFKNLYVHGPVFSKKTFVML